MNSYEEVIREIEETRAKIADTKKEILIDQELIEQNMECIENSPGPRLREFRQSIRNDNENLQNDILWREDELESLRSHLRELKAEKARLEGRL